MDQFPFVRSALLKAVIFGEAWLDRDALGAWLYGLCLSVIELEQEHNQVWQSLLEILNAIDVGRKPNVSSDRTRKLTRTLAPILARNGVEKCDGLDWP